MTPIEKHPAVQYVGDGRWRLFEKLEYEHPDYGKIVVPKGTETDLDSVPRLPFAYLLTKNASVTGAVIHDWLYLVGRVGSMPITRKEADQIFRDVMEEEGVSWWQRALIYRGVRLGGRGIWRRYRDQDREDELSGV